MAQVDKRNMLLLLIERLEERFIFICAFLAFPPVPVRSQALLFSILIRVGQNAISLMLMTCFSY